jgi:hypothetical protein
MLVAARVAADPRPLEQGVRVARAGTEFH